MSFLQIHRAVSKLVLRRPFFHAWRWLSISCASCSVESSNLSLSLWSFKRIRNDPSLFLWSVCRVVFCQKSHSWSTLRVHLSFTISFGLGCLMTSSSTSDALVDQVTTILRRSWDSRLRRSFLDVTYLIIREERQNWSWSMRVRHQLFHVKNFYRDWHARSYNDRYVHLRMQIANLIVWRFTFASQKWSDENDRGANPITVTALEWFVSSSVGMTHTDIPFKKYLFWALINSLVLYFWKHLYQKSDKFTGSLVSYKLIWRMMSKLIRFKWASIESNFSHLECSHTRYKRLLEIDVRLSDLSVKTEEFLSLSL